MLLQTDAYPTALIFAVAYGLFFGSTVAMNQAIYADYFVEPYPARSTVAAAGLPKGARVEVDVVAELR